MQVHLALPHLAGYLPPDAPVPLPPRSGAPQSAHALGPSARNCTAAAAPGEPGGRGCEAAVATSALSAGMRAGAAPAMAVTGVPAAPPVKGPAGARAGGPCASCDRGRAARLRVLLRLDDSQVLSMRTQQLCIM